MSRRIYLDDCAFDRTLRGQLRAAGHQVVVPADVGLAGAEDSVHLDCARANGLIRLTKNPDDFEILHSQNPIHPGILLIYQDNDLKRDMSPADIVRAIKNLEDANVAFTNQCHSLNAWQY